ncbi:MAG: chromate transporter [Candidatus Doudnabacteria bacterium]|nr:chromate transporter [Candidatus Doudnabacteria bacterium]
MNQQVPGQNSPGTPTPTGDFMQQMENFFNTYLHKKAPFHLPLNAKEWIVKYGPWIALIIMALSLPVILATLGLTTAFAPATVIYGSYRGNFLLEGLLGLASFVLEAAALPGLFKRSLQGWKLVYYSALISAVAELLSVNIIGFIISLAVSMYFLFEIKEYYK